MITWVQDEPRPDTLEDREHRAAEEERRQQVEAEAMRTGEDEG